MNANKFVVRFASNVSVIWFRQSKALRYSIVVISSAVLGWLTYGYAGEKLSHALHSFKSTSFSVAVFSVIGFFSYLFCFYIANIIMRYQLTLSEDAFRDSMSGLYNRRYYRAERRRITQIAEDGQLSIAVFFIDLNDFGQINKKYQHRNGDQAIKVMARVLQSIFKRRSDVVVRYGGDEFIAICLLENASDCEVIGNQLRQKVSSISFFITDEVEIEISGAVGWAVDNNYSSTTLKDLIDRADAEMKIHKAQNKLKPAD